MDQGLKKKREKNPKETAGIFSQVFFIFTAGIFRKGLKQDLQEEDVYEILDGLRANKLGDRLEKAWDVEKEKSKPWIMRSIFKVFGWEWVALGVIEFVATTTLLLPRPLLTGKVVAYFSKNQTEITKETAYMYASLLIGATALYTVYAHTFMLFMNQLTMKIRIACSSLIYRKALRLSSASLKEMTCGRVVTLLTKDIHGLDIAILFVQFLWIGAIHSVITVYMMYAQVGQPALYGVGVLLLIIPVHVLLGKAVSNFRLKTASKTDKRVRITQEILTAIRIIKMYTWERFFAKEVNYVRKQEIRQLKIIYYIKAFALALGGSSLGIGLYVCLVTYIAMGLQLTAEKTYVIVGCFTILRVMLTVVLPTGISQIAESAAALKRITEFLTCDEVAGNESLESTMPTKDPQIIFQNVSASSDIATPIFENINLEIKPGLTAIIGPVGCGKTMLLKLILKDIPATDGLVRLVGKTSYASQQPWLFPSSVKQNILFGEPLDEKRYQKVVKVCALRQDFDSFPYGDATNVSDNGLNLSSGQKARINLARAVYKDADVYLLDDCLSAVDSRVGKYIFRKCLQKFLKNQICVVVTHHTQFLQQFDDVIVISEGKLQYRKNNKSSSQLNDVDLTADVKEKDFDDEIDTYYENLKNNQMSADEAGKMLEKVVPLVRQKEVYEETKQEGVVDRQVYKQYIKYGGGWMMMTAVFILFILAQAFGSSFDYFVSYWVDLQDNLSGHIANGTTNSTEFLIAKAHQSLALNVFTILIFGATVMSMVRAFVFFILSTRASVNIHKAIFNQILVAPMSYFDTNMSGNTLNRFSRDLGIIDELLPYICFECTMILVIVIGVLIVVLMVNPIFVLPSSLLAIALLYCRKYYLRTGRSIKRLEGATRSPVIGHLNASMEGLTTIRASESQNILMTEFDNHLNFYNSTAYMQLTTDRAFGLFTDSIALFYVTAIILSFFTFITNSKGGEVGLAITQSLTLSHVLQWGIRHWTELETLMTSVERALEYTKIQPENKSGTRPDQWPSNGRIEYKKVDLRYSETGDRVLKDLNFSIESKQKIGIVGRTGSGKSSIISVLFKLYEFGGSITIDGVDINTIDTDILRSSIAIIPQDPVLFIGTLRNNLDPNQKCTDQNLWDALEEVEMKAAVASLPAGLDTNVSEGGSSFSIGQKQLLCLIRAIIRKNKVLVLDEATANIDSETDTLIQNVLKKHFASCTVITVAHRLNTILDSNKVLVMDSGRIVEFDDPQELLKNDNGVFYQMVGQSGLLR